MKAFVLALFRGIKDQPAWLVVAVLLGLWGMAKWEVRQERARGMANIEAMADSTRKVNEAYERLVVVTNDMSEVIAAAYAKPARGREQVAGVKVRIAGDSATPVTSATRDTVWLPDTGAVETVRASVDTLGVAAGVAITGARADWSVVRRPTELTIEFMRRGAALTAVAQSSDGARLEIESPYLIEPIQTPVGPPSWAAIGGVAAVTFLLGLLL